MNSYNKIILLVILAFSQLLLFMTTVTAQSNVDLKARIIQFSSNNLKLQEALDELNELPDINIVYSCNKDVLKLPVKFSSRSVSVQKALTEIESQAPVDIVFNDNHIIIKNRQLKDSYKLKGTVLDAKTGEALVAASIYIIGTNRGKVSGSNGEFSFDLPPGNYDIGLSYIGYKNIKTSVNLFDNTTLDILLEPLLQEIGEVKIIGAFGEIIELERGRPIEQIESKVINRLNTNVVNDALHGTVNGVWTTKTSGAPGDHNRIRIRGISSIFGSADPLYIVDGAIVPVVNSKSLGINDLNIHDIENITLFKDASSTTLYGCLGGNGVILIETKKGGGETKFNFNIKRGVQWISKRYPLMNAEEFLTTLDSSDFYIRTTFYHWDYKLKVYQKYPDYLDNLGKPIGSDDFQEELFQRGNIAEYQLSGQGSFKKIDYYLSGNYYTHQGIVTNSGYDKYSLMANLSKIVGEKLSLRLLYGGSFQLNKNNLNNYMGNPVIYRGINYEPAYRYTPDSLLHLPFRLYYNEYPDELSEAVKHLSNNYYTPDMLFHEQYKIKTEILNTLNFNGMYRITKDLSFHPKLALSLYKMLYTLYWPEAIQKPEEYLSSDEHITILNQQYDLRFKKLENSHNISGFVRYRNYKDNVYWSVDSIKNINLNEIASENEYYIQGSQVIFGESGSVVRSINSGTLNINYTYRNKYAVSAILIYENMREGSLVQNSDFYYSLALDYDISKEEILRIPQWINGLHIYANTGKVGNYSLNSLSNDLFSTTHYASGDKLGKAVYTSNLANHSLKPEKITEYNIGTKIALMENRAILSGDYYLKYYDDLLIYRAIPYYYAGGLIYQNIGKMKNQGIEVSLELTLFDQPDFYWTTKFGFASNNQEITKLAGGFPINFESADILYPDFHIRENEALGSISAYSYQGIWIDSIYSKYTNHSERTIKYLNRNGIAYLNADSSYSYELTRSDKTIIGKSIPDFTFNWMNTIEFKNFTCEMLWYGVYGIDKYNATRASTYITGNNREVQNFIRNKTNCITDNAFYQSSYFVEDASFFRLKTLTLRYNQKKKILGKIGIEYAVSFENLVTITTYSGYDPEAAIYTFNNFSDNSIDKGSYPNPRGVFFSLNLTF